MIFKRLLLAVMTLSIEGCSVWSPLATCHTALEWPITLNEGIYESPTFQTKYGQNRRYGVSVNAHHSIPFKQLGCYMGMNSSKTECANDPVQINLTWEILAGDRVVASGAQKGQAHTGGWSQESVERGMTGYIPDEEQPYTRFVATEGQQYRMRIRVLESGALLMPAVPYIKIQTCYNPVDKELR